MLSTASKQVNIQDAFLAAVRRAGTHVTVFLMNGFQMRGVISAFDPYVVVVSTEGKQQVVYKHAISTITPEHPVDLEPQVQE